MPSLPLDVVIAYNDGDNGFVAWDTERITRMGWGSAYVLQETSIAMCHSERFKVLREMHEVRKFRLVFCAETVLGHDVERVVWNGSWREKRQEGDLIILNVSRQ